MENHTLETGLMIWLMEMVYIKGMASDMKENGRMIYIMVTGQKYGKVSLFI